MPHPPTCPLDRRAVLTLFRAEGAGAAAWPGLSARAQSRSETLVIGVAARRG